MTSSLQQADILILGGGLAGAAAAIPLARAGRSVLLLERDPAPKHKVCGEFLSAEALHLLASLGIDPAAHGAVPIHIVRLSSGAHTTEAPLPFPAQSLTRRCLDALLLTAAEHAGAQVLRSSTVDALTQSPSGWQAHLSTGETLSAPLAILATGKHDLRGFPRPQGVQGDLVALKMYLRLTPGQTFALSSAVELLLYPHGYAGLEPVEDNAANLTCLVRRHHLARLRGWEGLFAEILRTSPHAATRLRDAEPLLPKPLAITSIPYGFVRKQALAPNLYAIGDQAAVIPSFTGDGMSIALYTGLHAAQAILDNQPSDRFQRTLHTHLRWQVARATVLSRALLHTPTKNLLTSAARLWPGALRTAATLTRLPKSAVR